MQACIQIKKKVKLLVRTTPKALQKKVASILDIL